MRKGKEEVGNQDISHSGVIPVGRKENSMKYFKN